MRELAVEAVRRGRAAPPRRRRWRRRSPVGEEAAGGDGVLDRQDRRQRLVVDARPAPAATRACSSRLGDHPGDGAGRRSRPRSGTAARRAAPAPMSFSPGTSSRGEHGEHARRAAARRRRRCAATRACACGDLHRPGVRDVRDVGPQVVDVAGGAGDVADRRFVRQRRADLARHRVRLHRGLRRLLRRRLGEALLEQPPDHRAAVVGAAAQIGRAACRRVAAIGSSASIVARVHGRPAASRFERGGADRRRRDAAVGDAAAARRVRPASGRARTPRRRSRCRRGRACSPCRSAGCAGAARGTCTLDQDRRPAAPRSCGSRGRSRAAARCARPAALASVTDGVEREQHRRAVADRRRRHRGCRPAWRGCGSGATRTAAAADRAAASRPPASRAGAPRSRSASGRRRARSRRRSPRTRAARAAPPARRAADARSPFWVTPTITSVPPAISVAAGASPRQRNRSSRLVGRTNRSSAVHALDACPRRHRRRPARDSRGSSGCRRRQAAGDVGDRPVAGAAAQVAADRLRIEAVAAGPVVLAEQADDEAGRAVAALRPAGADHARPAPGAAAVAGADAFDGDDGLVVDRGERHQAAVDRLVDGAAARVGPAHARRRRRRTRPRRSLPWCRSGRARAATAGG